MTDSTLKDLLRCYELPKGFVLNSDLKKITDWGILAEMWAKASGSSSVHHRQIEARMAEVLPRLLPNVSSVEVLGLMCKLTSDGSRGRALIESRIEGLLKAIDDWHELCCLYDSVSHRVAKYLVGQRMEAVLPLFVQDINDWGILVEMRSRVRDDSSVYPLIEARMAEVLSPILENITDWDKLEKKVDARRYIMGVTGAGEDRR